MSAFYDFFHATKYLFARDQQNCAWIVPIYLEKMYTLKEEETEIWQFLTEENFSINKSDVNFSAIEADHIKEITCEASHLPPLKHRLISAHVIGQEPLLATN